MKITLLGEDSLRLEPSSGMLTIEAPSHDRGYSPFHMLGSALAGCTFWVLQSWGSNKDVKFDDLKIEVQWKFVEGEHRVEKMDVSIKWPSLPPELWPRALRAAHVCGVHQTLAHGVEINVQAEGAESAAIE
jgi:uncharacterized OsmC-like protein